MSVPLQSVDEIARNVRPVRFQWQCLNGVDQQKNRFLSSATAFIWMAGNSNQCSMPKVMLIFVQCLVLVVVSQHECERTRASRSCARTDIPAVSFDEHTLNVKELYYAHFHWVRPLYAQYVLLWLRSVYNYFCFSDSCDIHAVFCLTSHDLLLEPITSKKSASI